MRLAARRPAVDVFLVEAAVHARLVVGGAQHVAEHRDHARLGLVRAVMIAPGLAHELGGARAVAFGEQRLRQRVAALWR